MVADYCAATLPHLTFLAAATTAESAEADASLVLAGVLLSLVVIYFASKLGGEICARINLPTVLGELVGGVVVGVSALHLLIFLALGLKRVLHK